jgi:hypothetical protein
MLKKYENPDRRCFYPFSNDPVGYCWSFAHHVDGTPRFADIKSICASCEYWRESPNFDKDLLSGMKSNKETK